MSDAVRLEPLEEGKRFRIQGRGARGRLRRRAVALQADAALSATAPPSRNETPCRVSLQIRQRAEWLSGESCKNYLSKEMKLPDRSFASPKRKITINCCRPPST